MRNVVLQAIIAIVPIIREQPIGTVNHRYEYIHNIIHSWCIIFSRNLSRLVAIDMKVSNFAFPEGYSQELDLLCSNGMWERELEI
ncbi:hypothetical protein BYT27DRAFT_7199619 [Phlegmacium glaucopus]|nr:hypothetical protein BYT27DRAFT_7199619 [Phlegmacium glaucopus]